MGVNVLAIRPNSTRPFLLENKASASTDATVWYGIFNLGRKLLMMQYLSCVLVLLDFDTVNSCAPHTDLYRR